jgi:transketolase
MWEALICFAHHRPANLTVLVDLNGLQGFGATREVASMDDLGARLRGFGLPVLHVDGHDHLAIAAAVRSHPTSVILLHTTKGKGVSFMENRMEWHYLPINAEQYAQALAELEVTALSTDQDRTLDIAALPALPPVLSA